MLTAADLGEMVPQPPKNLPAARPDGRPLSIEEYAREIVMLYQDRHGEAELAAMLGMGRKALWLRRRAWGLHRRSERGGAGTEPAAADDDDDASRSAELHSGGSS